MPAKSPSADTAGMPAKSPSAGMAGKSAMPTKPAMWRKSMISRRSMKSGISMIAWVPMVSIVIPVAKAADNNAGIVARAVSIISAVIIIIIRIITRIVAAKGRTGIPVGRDRAARKCGDESATGKQFGDCYSS